MDVSSLSRVFIVEPFNSGWIIEKLMRDIRDELHARGHGVRIGPPEHYQGEEIYFNSRYLYAAPQPEARVNSVFVTHIDDHGKESEIRRDFAKFDSFVCLSPQESGILRAMGCPPEKATGINLPPRATMQVKRPRLCVLSARYPDGRKNERWLLDYFDANPARRHQLIICLMGYDWETFGVDLAARGISFEIYRYDRSLPDEYERQKSLLQTMDYLICMGFDSGNMCCYDGLEVALELILPNISYHQGLGRRVRLFDDRAGFFAELDDVADAVAEADRVFETRGPKNYVSELLAHWEACADAARPVVTAPDPARDMQILRQNRENYQPMSLRRAAASAYRHLRKAF
jgi:hypothetical protein